MPILHTTLQYLHKNLRFNVSFEIDALDIFDGGKRSTVGLTSTAGIWSTYPFASGTKTVSNMSGFADQVNHPIIQSLIALIKILGSLLMI